MNNLKGPIIKICGIKRVQDALAAIEAGANIIGLVFVPDSKRFLNLEQAKELCGVIRGKTLITGVFMNQTMNEVIQICSSLPLDFLQLHGSEQVSDWQQIGLPLLKRILPTDYSSEVKHSNCTYVLDPGAGSGIEYQWHESSLVCKTAIIAGGLNPENVRRAVLTVKPLGVDISSGVEDHQGNKDPNKMALFVKTALSAFTDIENTDISKYAPKTENNYC